MRYIHNIISFLLVTLLVGCVKELPFDVDGEGVTLSLLVDGGKASSSSTRAASETAVADVWVMQFNSSGVLVRKEFIASVTDAANIKMKTVLGKNMSLLLLANISDAALFNSDAVGTATLTNIKAKVLAVTPTLGTALPTDASVGLPMIGEKTGLNLPVALAPALEITLTRLVSKIVLKVKNHFETGFPKLTISSTQLRRVPTVYALQPTTVPYPATTTAFMDYTVVSGDVPAAGRDYVWYMVPNQRGTGTATDPRLKGMATAPTSQGAYCTYVDILGSVQATATSATADVHYRLYLGKNNTTDYNIEVNTAYTVNVELTGFNSADARMTITTSKFDLANSGTGGYNDNVGWEVPFYGDLMDGGVLYWLNVNDPYRDYKVVAFVETKQRPSNWSADKYVLGTGYGQDENGGEKNILAMQAFATKNNETLANAFAAGNVCYVYQGQNGTDPIGTWYLPSKNELQQLGISNKINPEIGAALKAGGGVVISSVNHWSATESSANSTLAWVVEMYACLATLTTKSNTGDRPVRCIRHAHPWAAGDYCEGGLVFWANPASHYQCKVLSLDEAMDGAVVKRFTSALNLTNMLGTSETDGSANTEAMRTAAGAAFETLYPAAAHCYNYKGRSGMDAVGSWYLPAKNELLEMYAQWLNDKVSNVILAANWATQFTETEYLSSTNNATSGNVDVCKFTTTGGGLTNISKLTLANVRCIKHKK